jgi:hypothetical protein
MEDIEETPGRNTNNPHNNNINSGLAGGVRIASRQTAADN